MASLRVGDVVFLQASELGQNLWLCAEGHLSDEVFVTQNDANFSNCLWEVFVQCQYSADMEWQEAQDNIRKIEDGEDGFEVDKKFMPALLDKLHQIKHAAIGEIQLNKKVMQLKLGKVVTFGDVIQLRHLKSKRILTVSSYQLAKQEKENMRILADEVGDPLSYVSIIPKGKNGREGGTIKSGSECFIRVHEKSSEFLRAVKKYGMGFGNDTQANFTDKFEVNCSPEGTTWTMHIFHPNVDPRDKIIYAQTLVTLGDPEAGTCVTVHIEPDTIGAAAAEVIGKIMDMSNVVSARVVTTQLAGRNPEYASMYIGSEMMWLVEKEDMTEGGLVTLWPGATRCILMHYNTGLYLRLEFDGTISAVRDRKEASPVEMHATNAENNRSAFIDGQSVSISISGTRHFICTNDTNIVNPDGTLSTLCETTSDVKMALRLTPSLQTYRRIDSDVHLGVSAVARMRSFVLFTEKKMPAGTLPTGEIFTAATTYVRLLFAIVDVLCNFLGEDRDTEVEESKLDKSPLAKLLDDPIRGKVTEAQMHLRQCVLREQGLIDVLLDLLVLCSERRFDQVKLNAGNEKGASGGGSGVTVKPGLLRKSSSVSHMMVRRDSSSGMGEKESGSQKKPETLKRAGSVTETVAGMLDRKNSSTSRKSSSGDAEAAFGISTPKGSPMGSLSRQGSVMKALSTSFRYAAAPTSGKRFKVGAGDSDSDDGSKSKSDSDSDSDREGSDSDDNDNRPGISMKKMGDSAAKERLIRKQSVAAVNSFQNQARGEVGKTVEEEVRRNTVSEDLANALLRVVFLTAKSNHFNQLHISNRLPVILSLVTSQNLAVKCMRELLRDNLKILQSTVHQADIDAMVNNIRNFELNTTFLKLLQSTCSCPKGVDSTQRMVVLALYGEGIQDENVIMSIIADEAHRTRVNWSKSSNSSAYHYIPQDEASLSAISDKIMGGILISKGLPQVVIKWQQGTGQGKDPCISMLRLFNTETYVRIEALSEYIDRRKSDVGLVSDLSSKSENKLSVKRSASVINVQVNNGPGTNKSKAQKRSLSLSNVNRTAPKLATPAELKSRVADYLIQQLYLVADLCLDRNYVSIRILEKIYSYNLLITILKRDDLSNALKAPTCRILRTLWVDREPQVAKIFPNLIRTQTAARQTEDDMSKSKGDLKAKRALPAPPVSILPGGNIEDGEAGFNSTASVYTFSILQQIISDYLWNHLNTGKRDEYSYEILELLQTLMKFGFYSADSRQLQDVIVPIIRAMGGIKTSHTKPDEESEDDAAHSAQEKKLSFFAQWAHKASSFATQLTKDTVDTFSWQSIKDGWAARLEHRRENAKSTQSKHRKMQTKANRDSTIEFWEQRVINALESITGMIVSLSIVVIVCVVSIANIALDNNPTALEDFFSAFDIFVSVYFSTEIFLRIYCHLMMYADPFFFFNNGFNNLDFTLVAMDLVLVGLGTGQGSLVGTARLSRIARVMRLLRLLRIFRALRLLKKIADVSRQAVSWKIPDRFSSLSELDVKTLTSMLGIMSFVYKHIQDAQLDTVVCAFDEWNYLTSLGEPCDAVEVYHRALDRHESTMHEIPPEFDNIVLDILMYSDTVITREALQLLMTHKNSKQIMFEVLEDLHLVYSRPVEAKLSVLTQTINDLQRMTEMYEIWQDMDTEKHEETAMEMLAAAQTLQRLMMRPNDDKTLENTSAFISDSECQKLVRNLRGLDTCISAFETLYDGGREELHPKVVKILRTLSAFFVAFLRDNERNQLEAFAYLPWFIERIDDGFDTHLVVRAILYGNYRLINECVRSYISFFAQKILTSGRKVEYLCLFLGNCEKSYDDKTFIPPSIVISEITRILIGKEWKHHILLWLCAPGSTAYGKRSAALDEFKYSQTVPMDHELCPELQYHVAILKILAACRVGPRLQAIYPLDHIIHATLDTNCLYQVRIPLAELLLQLLESGIDSIDMSEYMWRFVDFVAIYFEGAMSKLTAIMCMPVDEYSCFLRTQLRDWILIVLPCLIVFFSELNLGTFGEVMDSEVGILLTTRTDFDVQKLIKKLYENIRQFMEFHANALGNEIIESCGMALLSLCHHSPSLNYDYGDVTQAKNIFKRSQPRGPRDSDGKRLLTEDITQAMTKKKFDEFVSIIRCHKEMKMQDQSVALFAKIPLVHDPHHSDVRFDVLLKKFAFYVRSLLHAEELNGQKSSHITQAIWVIQLMRRLLEREQNGADGRATTIASSRGDNDGIKNVGVFVESVRSIELRSAYMNEGLITLCLELCSFTTNHELVLEAMELLVAALNKTAAKKDLQHHIYDYLFENESTHFFKCVDHLLKEISYWCKQDSDSKEAVEDIYNAERVSLPPDAIVLRLLLIFCDGDFHPLKDLMRAQEKNVEQVNIIARLASMADVFSRYESPILTNVCLQVFKALRNIIYGLNKGNQEFLVLQTEVLSSMNRLMRSSRARTTAMSSYWYEDAEKLKECVLDVLTCAVEGHAPFSPVFDRIINAIELNVLSAVLMPDLTSQTDDFSTLDDLSPIESKYLELLVTLGKADEVLTEFGSHTAKENISSVEIVRGSDVHKVNFQKPSVAELLSEDFFSKIADRLDLSSQELKLNDFMREIKSQFIETQYQALLKPFGLNYAWAWRERIEWFMFLNAVVMNCLILEHFSKQAGFAIDDEDVDIVIKSLLIVQTALAALLSFLFFFIRLPAKYVSCLENGMSQQRALWDTISDITFIWRFIYLFISVVSLSLSYIFATALLLDWVALDATTRQVLKAVQYPIRQLIATLMIILIVLNVFAGAYFMIFNDECETFELATMFESWKLAISYGLRGEYGLGHEFHHTLGNRLILDVAFYFIVLAILRNSFHAIIIDTFGKLREVQFERDSQANNSCFICGVERHDYDARLPPGKASTFQHHREVTHNIQNYVYFVLSIWTQPPEEDNGIEMYVRKRIASNDIQWFPIGIAHTGDTSEIREVRNALTRGADKLKTKSIANITLGNIAEDEESESEDEEASESPKQDGATGMGGSRVAKSGASDGTGDGTGDGTSSRSASFNKLSGVHRKAFMRADHARDEANDGGLKVYLMAALDELSKRLDNVTSINQEVLNEHRASTLHRQSKPLSFMAGDNRSHSPLSSPSLSARKELSSPVTSVENATTSSTQAAATYSSPSDSPSQYASSDTAALFSGPVASSTTNNSTSGGTSGETETAPTVRVIRPSVLRATAIRPWGASPYAIRTTSAETIAGPSAVGHPTILTPETGYQDAKENDDSD